MSLVMECPGSGTQYSVLCGNIHREFRGPRVSKADRWLSGRNGHAPRLMLARSVAEQIELLRLRI